MIVVSTINRVASVPGVSTCLRASYPRVPTCIRFDVPLLLRALFFCMSYFGRDLACLAMRALPGREINAGHRTMSGNNDSMSGRNIILLDMMSGRKMLHCRTWLPFYYSQVYLRWGFNNRLPSAKSLYLFVCNWNRINDFSFSNITVPFAKVIVSRGGGNIDLKNVGEKLKAPGRDVRR